MQPEHNANVYCVNECISHQLEAETITAKCSAKVYL